MVQPDPPGRQPPRDRAVQLDLGLAPEALRDVESGLGLPGIRMVVYSLVLILLMIFRPQGIFGQKELSLKLLARLLPGKKGDK